MQLGKKLFHIGFAMSACLAPGASARAQETPGPDPQPAKAVDAPSTEPVQFQVRNGYLIAYLPAEKVTVIARPAPAAVGEDHGWATWSQRGDLLWRGEMEDSQGRNYNVRILPGYVAPAHHLVDGWSDAGSNMAEYGEAETWDRMGRHLRSSVRWGWEDSLWKFGLKGSKEAWVDHFETANRRTDLKTFGWPLAYPWAFLASTFETLLRVPLGVVGAAGGTATGLVIVPVSHVAWPAMKATYHVGIDGALLPVSGWAWQTLAAPPASLFASSPTPARADGMWMKLNDPRQSPSPSTPQEPRPDLSPATLDTLATYARETALLNASETEADRREQEELAAVRARHSETRRALAESRTQRLKAWAAEPANQRALQALTQEGGDPESIRASRAELVRRLVALDLSEADASTAVNNLVWHPLRTTQPRKTVATHPAGDDKTDPVRGALETVDKVTGIQVLDH